MKTMVDHLMVQEQLKAPHKRWKHMVAVMCLNLTYRKHVKIILPKLFKRYPNPRAYLRGRLSTQQNMLRPLGMWNVRTKRIRKMSEQFLTWDKKDASDLHGIGKYGSDSYQIFFMDTIPPDVQDKELKKHIDKRTR
jgi:methyl-CpG-binding domain protein 4